MTATLVQINVSRGGLPKRSIPYGDVNEAGIAGDAYSHTEIHGGPQRTLLLITTEGIEELTALGFALFPGAMGENLTTQGLDRRGMRLGQRYRIGSIVIELTIMRAPCNQLNIYGSIQKEIYDPQVKAGDPQSPRWGLGGFFARVLQPGTIRPGDPITLLDQLA